MNIDIAQVTNSHGIAIVERLAREIWNQHFTRIIGQQQVDYMLEKFQSFEAIQSQLDEGCECYRRSKPAAICRR